MVKASKLTHGWRWHHD